jgi:mRNA-degrading endonuclease RelE of RelBE toxin-antitoxin system
MKILPTEYFEKEIKHLSKKYPSLKSDLRILLTDLQKNPFIGDSLGQDCFKIRLNIVSKNRGKRGGGRIITCVKIRKETVYLLKIYDKSEQSTISDSELNWLVEQTEKLDN